MGRSRKSRNNIYIINNLFKKKVKSKINFLRKSKIKNKLLNKKRFKKK